MDIKAINLQVILQFRSGREVDGMDRREMILLTTVGAKSGRPHTTPLGIIDRQGDRLLVVANNLGRQQHPDWYINIQANSRVTVEADAETYEALANALPSDERQSVWRELEVHSQYHAESQARVKRVIPVVAITRLPHSSSPLGIPLP